MKLIVALVCLVFLSTPSQASAVDLAKIDKKIIKEPDYLTNPQYCLLVLGQSGNTHIWVAVDGKRLYIDLNKNGDLTDLGEKFVADGRYFTVKNVAESKATSTGDQYIPRPPTHRSFRIGRYSSGWSVFAQLSGSRLQKAGGLNGIPVRFGSKPETAPVLHFNGPMQMG
jgi:hypothetical protein